MGIRGWNSRKLLLTLLTVRTIFSSVHSESETLLQLHYFEHLDSTLQVDSDLRTFLPVKVTRGQDCSMDAGSGSAVVPTRLISNSLNSEVESPRTGIDLTAFPLQKPAQRVTAATGAQPPTSGHPNFGS